MSQFYNVKTNAGDAAIAYAIANNTKLNITHVAFGDGNGAVPTPDKTRTTLVHEVHRQAINKYEQHPTVSKWITVEAIIPSAIGDFWIREIGIIAGGALITHGSHAPFYKVADTTGVSEYRLKFTIDIQDASVVQLTLDESLIYATQAWVNENYIPRTDLIDNLTTADATKPLTAQQGKNLQDNKLDKTANAVSATKLATARTIGGVSFDGTANINLPGVNTAGNQNTTGNAATATKLATAQTISASGDATWSVTFDGSANATAAITLASTGVTSGTYPKVTVDAKGRVTTGFSLTATDIPALDTSKLTTGTLPVARGGTGLSATVQGGVMYGSSTTATAMTAAGTAGQVLNSNGTGTPTWVTLDLTYMPDAAVKKSVRAATTANITLSAAQTIDGIALAVGDRVLVKDQTTASQNGIYVVSATAWTRPADANTSTKIAGAVVNVDSGTVNGGMRFDTDFKTTDTLGTTSMTWNKSVDTGMAGTVAGTAAGTASAGTSEKYAREDHVHPIQTTVSGNAGTATKLQTARTINGVSFDGSANITIQDNTKALLTDFTNSKTENGYQKLANGLILQWGTTSLIASSGGTLIQSETYPITFPTAVLHIFATYRESTGSNADSIYTKDRTNTGFNIGQTSGEAHTVSWFAIGY